jgi:type I restriction enzyme S subunit
MTTETRLKRVAVLRAGGTPAVDRPEFWADDGLPWVSIGDMSDGTTVRATSRSVSAAGLAEKRLPVGAAGTLLLSMYASVGAVAELGCEATWNQALLGVEPIAGRGYRRFLRYWLEHLRPSLAALTRSNTQDNLNAQQVGNLPYPVLSLAKQQAIADYLDAETARLDALIAKRRRMITLLDERRVAEIVGILRSQDAPWLPLKRRWKVIDCKHRTPDYVTTGYPVISPGDVTPGRLDLGRAHRFVEQADFQDLTGGARHPRRGDVVYSRNASIGVASYVDTDTPFCMGQDVCLITSDEQDQLFLTYVLNSVGADQLDEAKIGSTFNRVNVAQVLEVRVPCPAPDAQRELAKRFDQANDDYSKLSSRLTRQIDLLAEHRQALITAAVTGELKVPTAA